MEHIKVFISGAISGDPNYRAKFEKVEKELRARGYLVMSPAILPEGFKWHEYMTITLAMLECCDAILMLEDWEKSRGAKLEHEMAEGKGIPIFYLKMPE